MRINKYNTFINHDTDRPYVVKEMSINYKDISELTTPGDIRSVMNKIFHLRDMTEEHVYMLALNTKCKLIGIFEVSHGTISKSFLAPREIYMKALLVNAAHIIIVHNHPSGDPTPSKDDIENTRQLREAGDLLGLPLLDHIIIGGDFYHSMFECGWK